MEEHGKIVEYRKPASADEKPLVQTLALYIAVFFATGLAFIVIVGSLYELLCWLVGHRL